MEILITTLAIYFLINILITIASLSLDWKEAKPFIGEMLFIGLPRLLHTLYIVYTKTK